jgi:CTP:molybdopterin cytidylyltransferase MocA
MSGQLAIAILAAGAGKRFGGGKLDAAIGAVRLGEFALGRALELGRPVIIVPPAIPQFARDALDRNDANLVINESADDGLGSSVALAAHYAEAAKAGSLLLLAADMPVVTARTLRNLIASCTSDAPAAVAYPEGHPGIPACFPDSYFTKLQDVSGEKGAAALLRKIADTVLVEPEPGELADVDTPAELEDLIAHHRL